MPGDSSVSQILSIVHEIQSSFDYKPLADVRELFLPKAYDKVWYWGVLFKLKSYGKKVIYWNSSKTTLITWKKEWYLIVSAHSRTLFENYLLFVVYCSVLVPLINKNDLSSNLYSICKIFADDTSKYLIKISLKDISIMIYP